MKRRSLTLGFLGIVVCAVAGYGQQGRPGPRTGSSTSSTMSARLPMPGQMDFDIKEQADSPLRLLIEKPQPGRMLPGSPVTVRNDGASPIAAFVLRVDVEPMGMNKMVIVGPKGLGLGEKQMQAIGMTRFDDSQQKAVVSVDYIRFVDGSGWGEDSLGRSKQIAAYLKGRGLALERLQTLLVGQDDTEIQKALAVFGSGSFAEPNLPSAGRPMRQIDSRPAGTKRSSTSFAECRAIPIRVRTSLVNWSSWLAPPVSSTQTISEYRPHVLVDVRPFPRSIHGNSSL